MSKRFRELERKYGIAAPTAPAPQGRENPMKPPDAEKQALLAENAALRQQLQQTTQQLQSRFVTQVADFINGCNILINAAQAGDPSGRQAMRDIHGVFQHAATLSSVLWTPPGAVTAPAPHTELVPADHVHEAALQVASDPVDPEPASRGSEPESTE